MEERTERNKALVRHMIEEYFNNRDMDALDRYVSPDVVDYEVPSELPEGIQGLKQYMDAYLKAFPDLRVDIEDVIAEDDRVVVRGRYTGTSKAEFFGIPATGKRVDFEGIDIFRLQDDKVVERWGIGDTMTMLGQMGLLPEVGREAA